MNLTPDLKKKYTTDKKTAFEAQRLAHEIAFAPIAFQVSYLMVKLGVLKALDETGEGLTLEQIAKTTGLSRYAVQVLLEASLSIGTVMVKGDKFFTTKAGWFLLNNRATRVNMEFVHEVCYGGLAYLEEALKEGKPAGLGVFGQWATLYEGLSALPTEVQEKWFAFDHYYSDISFADALKIIFKNRVTTLLDVGGNTGRFALRCVDFAHKVEVTVMDLPQQLSLMRTNIAGKEGAERIHSYEANLLDEKVAFPVGFDVIWMSQFLDCFSEDEVTSILTRAAAAMDEHTSLYILEAYWDRQQHETGAYCLTQISVYFTAIANGNSKMYYSPDMMACIEAAGLEVVESYDNLGTANSHTLFKVMKK